MPSEIIAYETLYIVFRTTVQVVVEEEEGIPLLFFLIYTSPSTSLPLESPKILRRFTILAQYL